MSSTIERDHSLDNQQGWQEQRWAKKANKLKAKHLPSSTSSKTSITTPLWGANEAYFKIDQKKTEETALRTLHTEYATALQELKEAKKDLSFYKTNTVIRLSQELDNVSKKNKKTITRLTSFKTTVNELYQNLTLKQTEIKANSVDIEQREEELHQLDEEFKKLKETYSTLNSKMENSIKLSEDSIKKSTFAPLPEKQQIEVKMQFAAKIGLSLEAVNEYEVEFEESLKICQETFKNTKEAFNAAGQLLADSNALLNAIDHEIGVLKNPTSWNLLGSHWGQQWRIFQPEKV